MQKTDNTKLVPNDLGERGDCTFYKTPAMGSKITPLQDYNVTTV